MSLENFQVLLDREGNTYVPGDDVSGRIIIDLKKKKKIRELKICMKGEAQVYWTTSTSKRDSQGHSHTVTNHHRASEEYFNIKYNLLSKDNCEIELPAGHSEYPFHFQLPLNIPCSFEHKVGYIRYTIKAVIDRPWKFDHECKTAFTVIMPLDLNAVADQCIGIDDEVYKTYCCCLCIDKGSMKFRIRVASTGYVPGQIIEAIVFFKANSTDVEVTRITAKLLKKITFHATTRTKDDEVHVIRDEDAGPFNHEGLVTLRLLVPPLPPSNLNYCRIIELKYILSVTIHVSGLHSKTERQYPIMIGTIPLRSAIPEPSAPPLENHVTTSSSVIPMPVPMDQVDDRNKVNPPYPVDNGLPVVPQTVSTQPIGFVIPDQSSLSSQWNMPPPSYEESLLASNNIKDENDSDYVYGANIRFAPRYPVFNFPIASSTAATAIIKNDTC